MNQTLKNYEIMNLCIHKNITISNEVLLCCRAILTMDARDQFPVDMVEQMLKFTPSPEERALLDEHADEIDHLARADRFLFELSK